MYQPVRTGMPSIGIRIQEYFDTYQRYFYLQYHQHSGQSKIFQNISFLLLGLLCLPLK